MVVLILISSLIIILVSGILFLPLTLVINTEQNNYYLELPGYFRADLLFENEPSPKIRFKFFFFSFSPKQGKKEQKKQEPKRNSLAVKAPVKLLSSILKKIRVKKFYADIDTGNFPLNAQLIPVAQALNGTNISVNINFNNTNTLDIKIITNFFLLIRTLIQHILITKKS